MTKEALEKKEVSAVRDFHSELNTAANRFLKQKQYKNAIVPYLNSMLINKNNIETYIGISKAYKGLKHYDKAVKYLTAALKTEKINYEVYYELGINYLLSARPYLAVDCFKKAIKLNPKNLNAQIQLAIAHELLDEPEMSLMIYDKILEEKPGFILCYNHKAGLYMQLGEFEEAARVFKQILKINPNYFRANLGLGICFDKLKRQHFAVRYYKKYIAKKPDSDTTRALVGRIVEIYSKKTDTNRRLKVVG